MTFNPLVFARLAENLLKKKNPFLEAWESFVYSLLSYINLPYKMKLIDLRIKVHKQKLEKYEKLMNNSSTDRNVGKKFNQIR